MKLLGLLGVKGSGKDTMAKYLIEQVGYVRIGFADELYKQVAQAYSTTVETLNRRETKESALPFLTLAHCKDLHFVEVAIGQLTHSTALRKAALAYASSGVMPAHAPSRRVKQLLKAARSPRWTLQLWGTEYRRRSKFGVDSYWLDIVAAIVKANPQQLYVITDVRFINEARFVEALGGALMRIRRLMLEEREAAERARKGTAAHPSEVELLDYKVDHEVVNQEGQPDSLMRAFQLLGLVPLRKAA